jgi:hypothetical protein
MKELDSPPAATAKIAASKIKTVSDEDAVIVETTPSKKIKGKK